MYVMFCPEPNIHFFRLQFTEYVLLLRFHCCILSSFDRMGKKVKYLQKMIYIESVQ